MPLNEELVNDNVIVEERFAANMIVFKIGNREIKLWELLVGLIILSMILPFLMRKKSRK